MPRLSKLIEKIEDRLANKWGCWYERNKARVPLYAVLGGIGWYLYGMFLNSLKLGKESVFNTTGEVIESIWVFNPFKNLFAVFTPFGLGVSAFIALMVCLITKKGYSWFSGYKFTRDARGFDILPDGTHGTSGFATKKELAEHLELGSAEEVMQMPRWLFSDPRYCEMSLDAKVTYTFLLNRFQLSRRNGWVNERGEVFVIFPRKALAKELRICEQRVTAAFKKLVELKLVWEKRCGRGDAILEILKEFKYLRVRQLHAMVRTHYRAQGIEIDARRMEIMLRQMRTGTNYVWLRGDVVSYGDRRIDPRLLEALDVMLELTRVQPGFYSKDGLHEPFLLRFTGNGKGAGYLFSVAWLDAATHIATVPRMKGERIIWISESGSFGEIDLPRHHFFAARQKDGTHRFFGSNEPEKI